MSFNVLPADQNLYQDLNLFDCFGTHKRKYFHFETALCLARYEKHEIFSVAEASACERDALTEDREKHSSTATKDLGASLPGPLFPESVSHE